MEGRAGEFPVLPFKRPKPWDRAPVVAGLLAGAFVAFAIGLYARIHDPSVTLALTLGFSTPLNMKVWAATVAVLFAIVQLLSALWMYGKLPGKEAPESLGTVHRISGRLAFIVSLPVAYHCLYALGFQTGSTRALLHSLFGCLFYGAFATKVIFVRSERLPGWTLPAAGGALFSLLVATWATSGLWFISENGFPGG